MNIKQLRIRVQVTKYYESLLFKLNISLEIYNTIELGNLTRDIIQMIFLGVQDTRSPRLNWTNLLIG